MALVALAAFALPLAASAATNPEFTQPTGTRIGFGTSILGTSLGAIKFETNVGTILVECNTASFTGTVMQNNGTETAVTVETTTFKGTATGGACTSSFGNITVDTNLGNGTPWCLRSTSTMNADEFQIRGSSCLAEQRSITFVLTSTTAGTCKYSRSSAIAGTYRTDTSAESSDAILSLARGANTEFVKEEGGILCPSSFELEGSFTLERDESLAKNPLYIS
jgi:hypothetical protein